MVASRWARVRTFDGRDWRDLAEASVTLAYTHAALRFGSPARVLQRATNTNARPATFTAARQKRLEWLVGVAGRHVVRVPCLTRAIALARMLGRRGVKTDVRLGVRQMDGRLDAHAWVELDGRPLNDDEAHVSRYAPLESPPATIADVSLARLVRADADSFEHAGAWRVPDNDAFCDALEHHGILPLVAERLTHLQAPLSELLTTVVRDRARLHAATDLAAEVELRRVVAALDDAGLRPILFKGAHLAYTDYARPDLRPRLDTDVLIAADPSARARAHDVLTSLGYDSPPHAGGDLVMTQRSYALRRDGRVVHAVDVHWRIANPQVFSLVLLHDEIARESVGVPAIGPAARAPSAPHALLIACVHRVAHHADSDHLIWLVDIDRLARRLTPGEWSRFNELCIERKVAAVCGRSLKRTADLLGTPLPELVVSGLAAGPAVSEVERSATFLETPHGSAHAALADFRALGSAKDRVRFAREHLLPPAGYMREVYARGSRAPLPWLYARRLVSGARGWWRGRRVTASSRAAQ